MAARPRVVDEEHVVAHLRQALPELLDDVEHVNAFADRFVAKRTDIFYRRPAPQLILKELFEVPVGDHEVLVLAKQTLKRGLIGQELVDRVQKVRVHVDQRRHRDCLVLSDLAPQLLAVEAEPGGDLNELR